MLNNELVRGFCYIEQSHASCSLMLKLYAKPSSVSAPDLGR